MFNHEFTKYEIATYLKEYSQLMSYVCLNYKNEEYGKVDNKKPTYFFNLYKTIMARQEKFQYAIAPHYAEMINIYELVLLMRTLVGLYDNYFDYFPDEVIEELDFNTDFVKTERKYTKKEVITNLVNAFKHVNDPKKDSFRIIRYDVEGEMGLEVIYNPGNQLPFHAILNIEDLKKICLEIFTKNKAELVPTIDIEYYKTHTEELALRKYYMGPDMNDSLRANLREKIYNNTDNKPCEILFLENRMSYEDYKVTKERDEKIVEDLRWWGLTNISGYEVLDHLIRKVTPLSCIKDKQILLNLLIADKYAHEIKFTYLDVINEAKKIVEDKDAPITSPLYKYTEVFGINSQLVYEVQDADSIASIADSIYYGYLFENLVNDEYIKLSNDATVPRENIVNSFNNMTWNRGVNDSFVLYDWEDEHLKNKEFKVKVGFEELQNCGDLYYQYSLMEMSEDKAKKFMDIPIHFRKEKYGENTKPIGISYIKNNTYYFYNLNKEYLRVCGEDQIQRYANSEEIENFIQELDHLSYEEKKKNKDLIEEIKKILEESKVLEEEEERKNNI